MTPGRRDAVGVVLAAGGAVGVVVGSFLPYARSGAATRTSYELVGVAERLELVTGPAATLARGWYLVPLVAAAAWLAAALGKRVILVTSCVILGTAALALGVLLNRSPLGADVGVYLASLAGALSLLGVACLLWDQRSVQ
ncbi:MAG TPA: hypothetical protein VMN58_07905 [Acidimicrobiales bacterium]|nr:hypothetical protein [Acidimicrobiales bacterium]